MGWKAGQRPPGHRLVIDWGKYSSPPVYVHKYGGIPSSGATLPACSGCGGHLHLLFQIDLADPNLNYLELGKLDYFFILTCLNCASYWEPMYYRLEDKGQEVVVLQEEPRMCVRQYPDILEEHSVSYRPLKDDEYPLTEDVLFRLLEHEGKHQLGGMPTWVQREEHIPCIACSGEMEYIAMADSELYIGESGFRERGHMFGDEGILYTFVCRRCGIFATKAQGV
jgi:hypothetical protein